VLLPRVIAHRGASGDAPENTLAAFRLAAEQGAEWVELDVGLTRDGVAIVIHDDTLERTTDGRGAIDAALFADIRRLDAGRWFAPAFAGERVPELGECLQELARLNLAVNIEIKSMPGRESVAAEAIRQALATAPALDSAKVLISSFRAEHLAAMAKLAPEWPRGYLLNRPGGAWLDVAQKLGCFSVNLGDRGLTRAPVLAARQAGFAVLVYTVNDVARARELLEWGVSAVFSDVPKRLVPALD
jgi:glycerophosphoryl diester phosphodiesterase